MKHERFDIIYSLGLDCACAKYLIKFGLRSCSGPFDWLSGANFSTRMNLILNDFSGFFEKDEIKLLTPSKDKTMNFRTDDYHNIAKGFAYYHDFRSGIPFDEEYLNVKQKYDRRIKRFLRNINEKKKVLLVYHAHFETVPNYVCIEYCKKLEQKFNKPIYLVIIENDFSKSSSEIEIQNLTPHLTKYKLLTEEKGKDGIYTNMGCEKNCSLIYSKFILDTNLFEHNIKRICPVAAKFLMKIFPIKKLKWFISDKLFFNE